MANERNHGSPSDASSGVSNEQPRRRGDDDNLRLSADALAAFLAAYERGADGSNGAEYTPDTGSAQSSHHAVEALSTSTRSDVGGRFLLANDAVNHCQPYMDVFAGVRPSNNLQEDCRPNGRQLVNDYPNHEHLAHELYGQDLLVNNSPILERDKHTTNNKSTSRVITFLSSAESILTPRLIASINGSVNCGAHHIRRSSSLEAISSDKSDDDSDDISDDGEHATDGNE